jgi:hypothetical protein
MGVKRWLRVVVVPLTVAAAGCSLDEVPPIEQDSRTPSTPSDSSVTIGGPPPSPGPSASPTASPAPGATPSASACALPPASPASPVCTSDPGHLLGAVEAAITRVTQRRPALFDFTDTRCDDCYKVLNVSGYYSAVQGELAAQGICTLTDGEELGAKDSNDSSEQFDILLASGHIRRGPGMYRGICYPAIF